MNKRDVVQLSDSLEIVCKKAALARRWERPDRPAADDNWQNNWLDNLQSVPVHCRLETHAANRIRSYFAAHNPTVFVVAAELESAVQCSIPDLLTPDRLAVCAEALQRS